MPMAGTRRQLVFVWRAGRAGVSEPSGHFPDYQSDPRRQLGCEFQTRLACH